MESMSPKGGRFSQERPNPSIYGDGRLPRLGLGTLAPVPARVIERIAKRSEAGVPL